MSYTLRIQAKALIAKAANAATELQTSVRELVKINAWTVLGYANFSEMWQVEAGFKCPSVVVTVATVALADAGFPSTSIATHIGYTQRGGAARSAVELVLKQHEHGVPFEKIDISARPQYPHKRIEQYGTKPLNPPPRARSTPKRTGATSADLVAESFMIVRRDADAVSEIARKANITKSELYRQFVSEGLARLTHAR